MIPPPPARERSRSTPPPPGPAAGSHKNRGEQASPRQRAKTPHRSRPEKAGEHEPEWYGDHAPHDQNDASDTRFLACPGKVEEQNEGERPPALLAPPAAQTGGTAHRPPPLRPKKKPAPRHTNATDPPHGGRTAPSQVGGNRDRTTPPQARQTEQGTGAGHAEGHGPRGTALPAPSAGTARGAHATPPRGGGSGRRGSARAHTRKGHAVTTRKANRPSSRNAQTAWNGVPASEGKGHPDGTTRHTQGGTRGAGRGERERHNTRYRPKPPEPAASAAQTRTGHCIRQGSSGALRHAPTPRLGSLRASRRGSHWRQASSTGPAAPAPRATTHKGGDAVGKRPQPRLRIDALTRAWRNGEAGERRGSEPCEPEGLCHQAGGASWRAPH